MFPTKFHVEEPRRRGGGPSFEKLLAAAGFVLAWLAVQKATENTLVTLFEFLAFNNALLIRKSSLRGGGLERARSSASKRPVTSEMTRLI